ncbi:MAG: DUF1573 domain-containing protein [Tepidisphaera sp.]
MMKYFMMSLLCFVLGTRGIEMVSQLEVQSLNADEPALKIVGETSVDAGKIAVGETAVCRVQLRNETTYTSKLRIVRQTCPCLKVTLSAAEILPGTEGSAVAQLTAAPVSGVQGHVAELQADFVDNSGAIVGSQRFTLAARYQADLAMVVEPKQLWVTVVEGERESRSIYTRSAALDTLAVNPKSDLSQAVRKERRREKLPVGTRDGEEIQIDQFEFFGDKPGLYTGVITVATEQAGLAERVTVHLRVVQKLVATPAGFAFRFDTGAGVLERTVSITDRAGLPPAAAKTRLLDHNGEEVSGSALTASLQTTSESVKVVLRLDTSSAASEGVGTVEILDKDGKVLTKMPYAWILRR